MSGNRVFVDTNVLVYAHDISAAGKHETARKVIADIWDSGNGMISTQVLQEFFVTVTTKIPKPIRHAIAKKLWKTCLHGRWSLSPEIQSYRP